MVGTRFMGRGGYTNKRICDAIRNRCILKFTYHDHPRVVEPHAYGLSHADNKVIRCYQVDGTSRSGRARGWRLMKVDEIKSLTVTEEHFVGPRRGYRRGDEDMSTIFCEL